MRAYLVAAALLVLILGSTALYIQQRSAAMASGSFAAPPATIAAGTAQTRPWRETIDAVGTIRAARGILLTAETSGDITAVHASSGDSVEAGDPLINIDEAFEVATRTRLEARLRLAEQLYERDARLIKENSIPQSQLDQSRSDLQSARGELAEVDAVLQNKRISAPFAGRLGIFQVRLGDYVEAGTPLVTLQDVSRLEVDFSVPDRYAPLMQPGLKIVLRTAAFPDRRFSATLQAVDSQIDESTRNLQVRASVDEGDGLLPGMFASLIIDLDRESRRVFVAETAVSYSLQGNLVYVIEEDDDGLFVSPRVVDILPANNGEVAIVSGIEDGERIVIAGQNKLYRNARVQIDPDAGI
ncbi:RND family efflux transporter, MFP subunit [Congregibacter litoralis KT71]|uniref:RND family efflux transporter, MFP subunit n=1 Tax=Congregibacter litoralis KT71 TaxID=314285 RepID=A4A403_9GAMM|nr:efflux RND transporter periplasmic adaptor subunit [Congregibacter litoralis]EAQ99426.2 RND family efflux transporter, MFP subunit [Congregibacter litoralis KT71]